jgi:hypothetical protein
MFFVVDAVRAENPPGVGSSPPDQRLADIMGRKGGRMGTNGCC